MTLDGEPDEDEGLDFESVDEFLEFQRRLLGDGFDVEDDLPGSGSASLEDETDEFDP